ncbi:MAG: ABC transporter ATP-binding protein [Spirochaetaceae bacterium]|nr:ABC transporter ATP-binding protein [Myxococcales bacterium]MCB9723804.1 ABC transporter ATP-binding protein [Spirochaetaceae bacterium]
MALPRIYAGRRRRLLWLLVANGFAQAVAGLLIALGLRQALGRAPDAPPPWSVLVAVAALGLVILVLRIREARDAERLGQDYVTRVRLRIFDRVAFRPGRGGAGGRWGVTMTRLISDLSSLRNWVSLGIARSIVAGIACSGLLVGLAFLSPLSAGVLAGVVIAAGLATAALTPRLRAIVRESRRRRGRLANNLGEKILASRTIHHLGRTRDERARVRSHSRRMTDALVRRMAIGSALRSLPDAMLPLAVAGLAWAAASSPRAAAETVVAMLLLGLVVDALRDLTRSWDHRLAFEEARRRIEVVLGGERLREASDAVELPDGGPLALRFARVTVEGTLRDFDGEVAAGERVLVVGPTGSGKSTLLALAARLFDPDSGRILLDGLDARDLRLDSLHGAVQLVSPELPLLRGTVAENVGYGGFDAGPDWLESVLRACGLDEPSAALPEGPVTRVEEQGRNLPQGVRARVSLARAAAIGPRLLLIDDPTFHHDREARRALEAVLALGPVTCLVAGASAAEARGFDRVWSLDDAGPRAVTRSGVDEGSAISG